MTLTNIPVNHWVNLRKLNKDSVIVDAGACIGEFVDGIRRYKNCRIIAIEPSQENLVELRKKNIEIIEGALVGRDTPKVMSFYKNDQSDAGSVVYGKDESYPVKTVNLDDLFKMCKRINFLKLDIEGAEKDLIKTMTQEDADKIDQISLEFHYMSRKNLLRRLRKFGFKTLQFSQREVYLAKTL